VLGIAVHPGAVIARFLLHLGLRGGESFVRHPSQEEGFGLGQLVELEPVPLRSERNDQPPRSNPPAPPGSSMTPSSDTNSETITLLTVTSLESFSPYILTTN
jgi:hypothetical protein